MKNFIKNRYHLHLLAGVSVVIALLIASFLSKGLARGFVYQKEQTKKERAEKEELKHQIEMFKIKNKN